jgi:hypothetical protein
MHELRRAGSDAERLGIYQFRYKVFAEHLGRDDLEGLDHQRRLLSDALDQRSEQFYVGEPGSPIAAVTVSPLGTGDMPAELSRFLQVGRLGEAVDVRRMRLVNWLLVDPGHAGSPLVPMLLSSCYELLLGADVDLLLSFCRPGLVAFYERFGLEQYSYATQVKGIGLRCPLMLVMRDGDRLRAARSPLLRILVKSQREERPCDTRLRLEPIVDLFQAGQILANDELWIETAVKFIDRPVPRLFDGLDEACIRQVMKLASVISCQPGEVMTRKGETSDDMFLIVAGRFEAFEGSRGPHRQLGPGDLFGEIEHLAATPRTESIRSVSAGHVAALKGEAIFQWMEKNPEPGVRLATNLARLLAGRIAGR